MSRLFPLRRSVEPTGEEPRLVDIDEDAADEVFGALSSETARSILAALYEEPRTASDLAEAVDTSLQNVRYHLEKLVDAELVEVADTWYSERGTEMKVYAPTNNSLVVFAGEGTGPTLREVLQSVLASVAVVAVAAAALQYAATTRLLGGDGGAPAETASDVGNTTGYASPPPTALDESARATTTLADVAAPALSTVPPGLSFLAGGLLVAVLVGGWLLVR